jgi:monoterpene epsilon-lactone hydrolase
MKSEKEEAKMDLVNLVLKRMLKKNQTFYDHEKRRDYKALREGELAQSSLGYKKPDDVKIEDKPLAGIPCEFLTKEANPKDKVIYYIHGGGFVQGCSATRRMLTIKLAEDMGYNVISVDYSLSPESWFPKGLEECLKVYQEILKTYKPESVAFLGESAGGNLVLALGLLAKDRKVPLPSCIVSFSPVTQSSNQTESFKNNAKKDYIVNYTIKQELIDAYLHGDESLLANPYVCPLYGDLKGLPPIFLNYSDSEVLADDTLLFNKKAQEAGVETVLTVGHNQIHTYPLIPMLKAAKPVFAKLKPFLDSKIK